MKEFIGFPKESFSIDIVCKSEDGDDGHLGLISQLGGELDSLINGLLFVMTTNEKAAIMVLTAAYKYKLIKNE